MSRIKEHFGSSHNELSRYRLVYVGGVDIGVLVHHYYRSQDSDHLSWERFTPPLRIQDTDTQDIFALLKQGAIHPPFGCAAIWVLENLGLCREHPYSIVGIHYIGRTDHLSGRNKAADFVKVEAPLSRPIDRGIAMTLCHGDTYMIRDGQISMICRHKGRRLIDPADMPSAIAAQRNTVPAAERLARPVLSLRG